MDEITGMADTTFPVPILTTSKNILPLPLIYSFKIDLVFQVLLDQLALLHGQMFKSLHGLEKLVSFAGRLYELFLEEGVIVVFY